MRRGFLIGAGASALTGCAAPQSGVSAATAEAAFPPLGRLYGEPGRMIHATDQGEGEGPPLILIHGASGNLRDWTFSIAPRLAASRRVIAMDRPGFGYSDRPAEEEAWRPSAQAAQLRAAAREMGAAKPVLVGHSWGASVALAWALDAPDEVSGVVVVSGVTMPWGGVAPVFDALGFGPLIAAAYNRRMVRTAESGGAERFIERAFRPQTPPTGYFDYVGAPLALRDGTLVANGDDLANTNRGVAEIAARYGELRVPLCAIHGEADWLLDLDQHGRAFAAATGAQLTTLPGVGHMAHHAATDKLATVIDAIA
ncbi:MAG: alpha/beta fold hydrolase [Paracoccaceae bacterium]